MKSRNKIILYLDNLMEGEEKVKFENELLHSVDLAEELKRIKNELEELKKYADADIDAPYFNNIIPVFRGKTKNQKVRMVFPVPQYKSFIPALTVVLVGLLLLIFNNSGKKSLDLTNLNDSELQNIASEYQLFDNSSTFSDMINDQISDKVDSLYIDEFVGSGSDIAYIESIDYNSLLAVLSNEEAETIYQQLINKNFTIGGL